MEGQTNAPRFLYWLVGILAVVVILGVLAWLYLKNAAVEQPATTLETPVPAAETDPVDRAGTEIEIALLELDEELALIDEDLNSTDDDDPTL